MHRRVLLRASLLFATLFASSGAFAQDNAGRDAALIRAAEAGDAAQIGRAHV